MPQGMTPQSREEISVLRLFPRLPEAMNHAISATKIFLKMQKKNNLFVITKTKDFAKYIITVTEKSPKISFYVGSTIAELHIRRDGRRVSGKCLHGKRRETEAPEECENAPVHFEFADALIGSGEIFRHCAARLLTSAK